MISKINISEIITHHHKSLNSVANGKIIKSDYLLFYGIPGVISWFLVFFSCFLKPDTTNTLIACFSIFAGFLFNLLAIIYSFIDKIKENIENDNSLDKEIKSLFIKQIHANISFCILLSVLIIFLLVLSIFNLSFIQHRFYLLRVHWIISYQSLVSYLSYLFIFSFLLLLLMILKRVHILLRRDLQSDSDTE